MKSFLSKVQNMPREDVWLLLVVSLASLLGLAGTAVFLAWIAPVNGDLGGLRPFFISLAATLIYSGLMGGTVYLLHPQKSPLYALIHRS